MDALDKSGAELERLQARVSNLAEEKSYLQLILRMIEQLNPIPGPHDMVGNMLASIIETIGGTNARIWYWIEGQLYYADFLGERRRVAGIDDPVACEVADTGRFIEVRGGENDSLMRGDCVPGAWIWGFPLDLGAERVGIIKLENVHIVGTQLRKYLPIFFSHAALILSNEIRNHVRLSAQAALREKTEELDSYFNSALDLFCIANLDGYFLKLNPVWQSALGYTLEDMQGKRFLDFVHPDDLPATLKVIETLAEQQPIAGFVNRYRHKNGSWRLIEWRTQPRGRTLLAAARDVTEKKKADDALRLAASVFANSQEGIAITDPDNHIIDVNAAFSRITGYDRSEVLGKNPRVLKSGRQDERFYQDMWQAIQTRGRWQGEIWNRRKSGEVYAEILSIDAVADEAGALRHYVGVFSDISPIKHHQAELERIAHFDTLTGLPNRRLLADRLRQCIGRSQRTGLRLAICYLDLDGFKPVNDQYGHESGDELLIEIGRRLTRISRSGDTVARIGGDEFVLLLSDLDDLAECSHALNRLIAAIAEPVALAQASVTVSASVGVTLFPDDPSDPDTLLRHADEAMYQVKASGKAGFEFYDPDQGDAMTAQRHDRP